MKLSISRAAVIQWLAFAVAWKGLFQGSRRQLPQRLRPGPVLGVGHDHVRRETVGEGAHLARRAAGGGLSGQREGAVARLGLLAQQQVHHVGLLVDPASAIVLVEAHGPEGGHLAVLLDVEVRKLLQLLLVGFR
jgi:hypothetical protein